MSAAIEPGSAPTPAGAVTASSGIWNELIVENPLLGEAAREQRRFFRTAHLGRFGTAIVIAIVALFYAWAIVAAAQSKSDGTILFSYIELVLLTLGLSGSVYGAISGERERATWDALILTRLTPAQIIVGKLIWRLRLTLIIAVLSIVPIVISRFWATEFDTTAGDAAMGQAVMISWGVLVSCFGLLVSALTKRSITSLGTITVSLITVLALIPLLYAMMASAISSNWNADQDRVFSSMLSFNPFTLQLVLTFHEAAGGRQAVPPGWIATGWPQIVVYLVTAIVCVRLTYLRLRQLEEPDRGRDRHRPGQ